MAGARKLRHAVPVAMPPSPARQPRVQQPVAMHSPLARYFTTSTPSLWAMIVEREPELIKEAQRLFDQITARQAAPLRSTSLSPLVSDSSEKRMAADRIWAVVAVVATRIARDGARDRRRGSRHIGRKRKNSTDSRRPRASRFHSSRGSHTGSNSEDSSGGDDLDESMESSAGGREGDDERDEHDADEDAHWHVVDFLVEAHVPLSVFLQHVSSLFDRLLLDPEVLEVTTQLKEEFTICTVLFEKYRATWKKVALQEPLHVTSSSPPRHGSLGFAAVESGGGDDGGDATKTKTTATPSASMAAAGPERTDALFRCGWLLFLMLKRRLSSVYTGLGQLYYLLLAVLKLVIRQAKTPCALSASVEAEVAVALSALGVIKQQQQQARLRVAPRSDERTDSGEFDERTDQESDQELLEVLCANPKVDVDEVRRAYQHVEALLATMVRYEGCLSVPRDENQAHNSEQDSMDEGDDEDHRQVVRGIFDPRVLRRNVSQLTEEYKLNYLVSCGCFDERMYLNEQSRQAIMGPRPSTNQHPHASQVVSTGAASRNGSDSHSESSYETHVAREPPAHPLAPPSSVPASPSRLDQTRTGTNQPPPSPFTAQAWQWHGASPPPSLSLALPRGLTTPNGSRLAAGVSGSGLQSPFVAQTPVTAAVETSQWIRDTLSSTSQAFVSPQLKGFFKDCTTDPTDRIAMVLQELSQRLMTSRRRNLPASSRVARSLEGGNRKPSASSSSAEFSEVDGSLKKTKNLAIALFYRVLEVLLVTERERLRTSNFSSLLNNETFLSSLFACSLEVVLKAHSLITLSFPFLLDTLHVNAFDFGKVIESFVKHVPKLPSALKRHMRDLEQMILDSLAWRSDSGLYIVLAAADKTPPIPQAQPTAATTSAPLNNGTDTTAETTHATGTATTSTTLTSTRGPVLQLFFRKVLSLAALRIFRLGNMLGLDAKYLNQVWTAIKECISSQHYLLRDRHLDQIVLCSTYGVCKVNHVKPEVTFKRIIDCYKKLQTPQWGVQGANQGNNGTSMAHSAFASNSLVRSGHDVIRDIKLDENNTRGDIIKFYNRCFIPKMKVFLLQFQAQESQMAAAEVAVGRVASTAINVSGGMVVTASTSDSVIVAEAAVSAAEKAMQSYGSGLPRTPVRRSSAPPRHAGGMATPPLFSSPSRSASLPRFTSAEVESLPVSVHQTSPKRVLTSNIYMSPLQNARLQQHRSQMLTPRSHALYAFGESPSRDLALINRAVNAGRSPVAPPPRLRHRERASDAAARVTSSKSGDASSSNPKRRRTG